MNFSLISIFIFILFFSFSVSAQKERVKGIEFYQNGDYKSAIHYLNLVRREIKKDDAEFWYVLGKSYFKVSDFNESRKAFEKAVKLKPENSEFRTDLAFANLKANRLKQAEKDANKALKLDAKNSVAYYICGLISLEKGKFDNAIANADQAIIFDKSKENSYLLKSDAILYKFGIEYNKGAELPKIIEPLRKSIENLENCLAQCANVSTLLKTKLDDSRIFYDYFLEQKKTDNNSQEDSNIIPLSLLKKPSANYTDAARQSQTQGTIDLLVYFSADGNIKRVLALNNLRHGLTEQTIKAANQITFTPQTKDGKPVSVVKIVRYSFTLY